MKNILLALSLFLAGCEQQNVQRANLTTQTAIPENGKLITLEHDNHQIILWMGHDAMMHHPSCKYCKNDTI